MSDKSDDDLVQFEDELEAAPAELEGQGENAWRVLIVDDEEQVHQATRYALQDCQMLGFPVQLDSVYSAAEAMDRLTHGDEYACVLLDVVMEREDAGFEVVEFLRKKLGNARTRIILRTGQPGYAPEADVIQHYDINDYKAKSELTRSKLLTTLTAAVRSYRQIRAIEESRHGLELIIEGASALFRERAVEKFARGVIIQLCSLLQIEDDGFLCCHYAGQPDKHLRVLAASGRYAGYQERSLLDLQDQSLYHEMVQVLAERENRITREQVMLYMVSPNGDELVAYVRGRQAFSELDLKLLELFSLNIAVGFTNAKMFEDMERLAFIDSLTGLPNREAMLRSLQNTVDSGQPFTLVLADLDNFQAVSDGLGREVGDQALVAVAQWLEANFGAGAQLARAGGDCFCWILTELETAEAKLQENFRELVRGLSVGNYELPISFTAGLARFPEHGDSASKLMQNAGIALKRAKATHKTSFCVFDKQYEAELQRRLNLAGKLRFALEREELSLYFQPQLRLQGRKVIGAEALLRWRPDGGDFVSPAEFIPVAESSGHIMEIGAWVLEQACKAQQLWRHELGQDLTVAVNLSLRQLRDGDFLPLLDNILERTGMNPHKLELEVTESVMMSDRTLLQDCLAQIRQRGIRVAIDDFGTGYSSLSYLQQLPVDRIKVDQSFVANLDHQSEDRMIVSMVVELGRVLGLKVVAEGVETQQQENQLRQLHCDEVQGYLYARPMPQKDFLDYLSESGF